MCMIYFKETHLHFAGINSSTARLPYYIDITDQ